MFGANIVPAATDRTMNVAFEGVRAAMAKVLFASNGPRKYWYAGQRHPCCMREQ